MIHSQCFQDPNLCDLKKSSPSKPQSFLPKRSYIKSASLMWLTPHFVNDERLDRVYARLLINHPYGWALYKKQQASLIQLGDCGYFDAEGDWCPIVRVTDAGAVAAGGWAPLLVETRPEHISKLQSHVETARWGPKESKNAHQVSLNGTAGSTIVVAPIQAGVTIKYENKGEKAGVLLTSDPVTCQRYFNNDLLVDWMKRNNDLMISRHGSIASTHGIWLVTKTYSAKHAVKTVMRSKSSSMSLGFVAGTPGVLTMTPESSWGGGQDASVELHSDASGVIVFLSGVHFGKPLFSSTLKAARRQEEQKGKILRGPKDPLAQLRTVTDESGNTAQLVLSLVPEEEDTESGQDESEDDN